ncbi:MAG: NAD(P)/FAD-dependent oxidoreductase [Burkholderiaceae bacterium]
MDNATATDILDVLVVGAGIAGISAAWHLQSLCPGKRFAVVEARERIGGTWDLFRYPGVRSDSDMYTLGFSFRPWREPRSIAEAPAILRYLRDTVREGGLDRHMRFGLRMQHAAWSSADACWTVTFNSSTDAAAPPVTLRARFVHLCCGYFRYDHGYTPAFPGQADFRGRIVHPQAWPDDLEVRGRRVVVIGSGATAVTLVPALAASGAQVTMLQRTPSYLVSLPARDAVAAAVQRVLPARAAGTLIRWKNALMALLVFHLCRRRPGRARAFLLRQVARQLPAGYDAATHFTPPYNPWEQRLCLVPDGDFFAAIRSGRARVVTRNIDRFEPDGVRLAGGELLAADVIVTATGLELQLMGGAGASVDGRAVDVPALVPYKGVMYSGVPNFAATFGYTAASWTLKADLTSRYVCRLLNHMDATGAKVATPVLADASLAREPLVDFSSGYFQRHLASLPRQGREKPWRFNQNYLADWLTLKHGAIADGVLRFSG